MSDTPNEPPQDEWGVVCASCFNILNPEKVMKSAWYQDGRTPPCFNCGGVTVEIRLADHEQFVRDVRNGKRIV